MILYISVVAVVTSPFSYLLLYWNYLFFPGLAKGCQFYLSFKKSSLNLQIFSIVFIVSISLISVQFFVITFLLLTLGFVLSFLSVFLRWKVRFFIQGLSFFSQGRCSLLHTSFWELSFLLLLLLLLHPQSVECCVSIFVCLKTFFYFPFVFAP